MHHRVAATTAPTAPTALTVRPVSRRRRPSAVAVLVSVLAAGGGVVTVTAGTSLAAPATNVLANPGFEHGLAGWTRLTDRSHLARSRDARVGRWSAALTAGSSGTVGLANASHAVGRTRAGQSYRVSVWVKAPDGAVYAELRLREQADGALVGQRVAELRLTDRRWHRIAFVYTAGSLAGTLDYCVLARRLDHRRTLLVDAAWLSTAFPPTLSAPTLPARGPTITATGPPPSRAAGAGSPRPANPASADGDTLFGTSIYRFAGQSFAAAYQDRVRTFGPLGVDRVFYPGLPAPWPGEAGYSGAAVVVSFTVDPRQVLTGAYDAALTSWFASAPRGRGIWWSYLHEPEPRVASGAFTAPEYRGAWQRIAGLARAVGNPDLHATLIVMCYTLQPASGRSFSDYFPGSASIDTLGFDCYNGAAGAGAYVDPGSQFGAAVSLAARLGKPFGIAELGSRLVAGDSGSARATWLVASAGYLDAHHAQWVTYFDSPVDGQYQLLDVPSAAAWRSVVTAM